MIGMSGGQTEKDFSAIKEADIQGLGSICENSLNGEDTQVIIGKCHIQNNYFRFVWSAYQKED